MPYLYGFFLVSTGMLFGYLLRYRDRKDESAIARALSRENDELRTSLRLAHDSNKSLDGRFERQQSQMTIVKQLCDEWSASRQQLCQEREQLEIAIAAKTTRVEELMNELHTEKQKYITLEDCTHQNAKKQVEEIGSLQQEWRSRQFDTEALLVQCEADLENANGQNARIKHLHHQTESDLAGLNADLDAQELLLKTAMKNANGLEQEYVSQESALKDSNELLKNVRLECAAAVSEKSMTVESLNTLQTSHQQAQDTIDDLRVELSKIDSIRSQVESLRKSQEAESLQLDKVIQQRDQSLACEESIAVQNAGLNKRVDNQEATIHRLRATHEQALEKLQHELESRQEIESGFQVENARLASQVEELKTTCQRISELEQLVQNRDRDEQQVVEELRTLREQYASSFEREQALKHQLEEALAVADSTVISFSEAMAQRRREAASYDSEYGGPTSHHETRGVVYTDAPETTDDLKQISGIAEVLEARLNDYGIYTFKQIMEWGPEAIDEFSRLLTFKDRIERDEWVAQARFFYESREDHQRSSAA